MLYICLLKKPNENLYTDLLLLLFYYALRFQMNFSSAGLILVLTTIILGSLGLFMCQLCNELKAFTPMWHPNRFYGHSIGLGCFRICVHNIINRQDKM